MKTFALGLSRCPQVGVKEERRVLKVRERRFERQDGVPGQA